MLETVPMELWPERPLLPRNLMPNEALLKAYEGCIRGQKSDCINTLISKASSELCGSPTRYIQTYGGYLWWSQFIEGYGWHRFRAPLSQKYAGRIDAFDRDGKHFRYPEELDVGKTEHVYRCKEQPPVAPETREKRRETYQEKKLNGETRKLRDRQLPKVLAREETQKQL